MIIAIVPATQEHLRELAVRMRGEDRAEITGLGCRPLRTLHRLWLESDAPRAALVDGDVAAVWGCCGSLLEIEGRPWLFTTPAVERAPVRFFRQVRAEVAEMLATRRRLIVSVAAGYDRSIRFFARLGFAVSEPVALPPHGALYRAMTIERAAAVCTDPFVVLSLPRSRSFWLSRLLSFGGWTCHHEAAITMRSMDDVSRFFRRSYVGSAETGIAPGWRLLRHLVPGLRTVVVRRPVDDVVAAMLHVDVAGVATYDRAALRRNMERMARALDRIALQPGVLAIDHAELDQESACAAIFRHCLSRDLPHAWWERMQGQNLQTDVKAVLRYYFANQDGVERFKATCKSELRRLAYAGLITSKAA